MEGKITRKRKERIKEGRRKTKKEERKGRGGEGKGEKSSRLNSLEQPYLLNWIQV